jgi:hypothetical protein
MKNLLILILLISQLAHAGTITPEMFGALGNGIADDAVPINKASAYGAANGDAVVFAHKTYRYGQQLKLYSNLTWFGDDTTQCILKPLASMNGFTGGFISGKGTRIISASGLSILVDSASNQFTYSGTANVPIGSTMVLFGPQYSTYSYYGYSRGLYTEANVKSGTTITGNVASTEPDYTATSLEVYNPIHNVLIQGLHFDFSACTAGQGIQLQYAKDCSIQGCIIRSIPNSTQGLSVGLALTGIRLLVDGCHIRDFKALEGTGAAGTAYSVNFMGNTNTAQNNVLFDCASGLESGGNHFISQGIRYLNNFFWGRSQLWMDFHGNSIGEMAGNIMYCKSPQVQGADSRHSGSSFHDNWLRFDNTAGSTCRAYWTFENAYNHISFFNNTIIMCGNGSGNNYAFTNSGGQPLPTQNLQMYNNHIYGGTFRIVNPYVPSAIFIHDNDFYDQCGYNPTISPAGIIGANNMFNGTATPPDHGGIDTLIVPFEPPPDRDPANNVEGLVHWRLKQ